MLTYCGSAWPSKFSLSFGYISRQLRTDKNTDCQQRFAKPCRISKSNLLSFINFCTLVELKCFENHAFGNTQIVMRTKLTILIYFCTIFSAAPCLAQEISLAGKWRFALDPDSLGYKENWSKKTLAEQIKLPGTTDEAKFGKRTQESDYGILTRAYKYIGPAWYQKDINIPADWANHATILYLERALWETKVYVDGKLVSTLSPLYVPHQHNIGKLAPGKHTLTICVNNDLAHQIGDKGHGYTEYTQSIWNGLVGKIALVNQPIAPVTTIKTYPNPAQQELGIAIKLENLERPVKTRFVATLTDPSSKKIIKTIKKTIIFKSGEVQQLALTNLKHVRIWDEFTPNLYELKVDISANGNTKTIKELVGFRKLTTETHQILINNTPMFVRGNLDCVHFPLTGYPSTKTEDWERIFRIYKSNGLNTVRFHSWCPPEAAFIAADKLGIYIQAEVIWLDWWMAAPNITRPEMDTKGFPQGLGKNPSADAFVQAEMQRILDAYGNHPSFVFFCIGNELGNSDFSVMEKWIKKLKSSDDRRLYAVSTARKITASDDYNVTHNIPNVGSTYAHVMNGTNSKLEENFKKATLPTIAHEVGQYPIYPQWPEIDKYTGVLKARNLAEFKAVAEKNGIASQDKKFHQASGNLQRLLYKNLIENNLLAPSSSGYQMLSLTDYAGQGEALVGWLDSFWDSKNTTSPAQATQYINAVVPAIITKSFVYGIDEEIEIDAYVRNNFNQDIDMDLTWKFIDKHGKLIANGKSKAQNFKLGKLTLADHIKISTSRFPKVAGQYTFELVLGDGKYHNSWDFFVFNQELKQNTGEVLIADTWDKNVDKALAKGGKVLLKANKLGIKATSHGIYFTPLFWSASFFPGQDNQTLGSYINDKHPAFESFPTENYTNWQWQVMSKQGKYFNLSAMPKDYQPIAQPISDFHYNEKLGSIFECKVGNGKLMVCGYNLDDNNISNKQLLYSLLAYMNSSKFNPVAELPYNELKKLFEQAPIAPASTPLPHTFENAALFVKTGASATEKKWTAKADKVLASKGYTYTTKGITTDAKVWKGQQMRINITPPQGLKGYVYLHFINPNKNNHTALVTIEGREIRTGQIDEKGKWIKLFMMREDTNDGKVIIDITAEKGDLTIDQMAIVNEE